MKKIYIGVIFILCLSSLIGCSSNKYNAEIINDVKDLINNDFLKENKVKAYYLNEEYVDGVDDEIDQYIYMMINPQNQ